MPNPDRVTIRQIRYFAAVAEQGSFRRAADRLDVTQPTLTAQIAALEESLDTQLFERSRAGTWPSAAGRDLLPDARRVLEGVQGFCDHAGSLAGGTAGTYRLGVPPTLGPYLLPHILPGIHAEYAGLKLYVREAPPSALEDELKNAQQDVILTTEPILARDLTVAQLFREPVKLAIAREHRLARKARINRSDLVGEEVLTIGEHHLFHRQITDLCERLGATVRRDYEGTSLDTLRHMVVMGMGLAFLPALYVKSEIRGRDALRVTDVEGINITRSHVLAWRPRSPARTLFRGLADKIRELVRKRLSDVVLPAKR
jgi:LysR family transcriptional regulator, hydrogen peroxide-inducible genes activator